MAKKPDEQQPLLYFKCQCILEDGIGVLDQHLSKARKILDNGEYRTDGEFSRLLKNQQKALDELKRLQALHLKFRVEYAREMVELVKTQAINVGPQQEKLQTVPYLTGRERLKELEDAGPEKRRKKSKK